MRFDHIGIFVEETWKGYSDLMALMPLRTRSYPIDDENLKVRTTFVIDASGVRYELIEPLGEDSPAHEVIRAANNMLNHIGYVVSDLDVSVALAVDHGGKVIKGPTPAKAFGGARTVFILTKLGFVIELIEDRVKLPKFAQAA